MPAFANRLIVRRASRTGFILDYGFTTGNTREEMYADFLENIATDGNVTPDQELIDFLLVNGKDGDILEQVSDCGNFLIICRFVNKA